MNINTETRNKIRKNLPHGYSLIIAERLNLSSGYVRQVATGHASNDAVIQCMINMAHEHQKKEEEAMELLNKLS